MSLKFQITSVLPALTLYDNILLALQAQTSLPRLLFSRTRGVLHDRVMGMLEQFRLAGRAQTLPPRFHMASSNGSRSRWRWRPSRSCCCSMNRPAA